MLFLVMVVKVNFVIHFALSLIFLPVADRLHTMRTLRSLPVGDAEKLKIAEEALNVYAPLAHRMGMMKVKGELEDLAFKHLHPEIFQVSIISLRPPPSINCSSLLSSYF
jgi:GTP diphosphokinase / guanosine-3',5'-bis(diphosphate) 3'-diphosphatase